jgi:hypothetical protein
MEVCDWWTPNILIIFVTSFGLSHKFTNKIFNALFIHFEESNVKIRMLYSTLLVPISVYHSIRAWHTTYAKSS